MAVNKKKAADIFMKMSPDQQKKAASKFGNFLKPRDANTGEVSKFQGKTTPMDSLRKKAKAEGIRGGSMVYSGPNRGANVRKSNIKERAALDAAGRIAAGGGTTFSEHKFGIEPKDTTKKTAVDYGDVTGVGTAGQTGTGLRTSTGLQEKPRFQELGTLSQYGINAKQMEEREAGSITKRNDIIAGNIYSKGLTDEASVKKYLEAQEGFLQATPEEQSNTIRAIKQRLGQIEQEQGPAVGGQVTGAPGDVTATTPTGAPVAEGAPAEGTPTDKSPDGKPGYYIDSDGKEVAILGYGDLDPETQAYLDGLSEAEKKQVDMMWGNDANAKAEYLRQAKRGLEYMTSQRDLTMQIRDIEGNIKEIQASQVLRDAGKKVDNLIQNYAYLGSMGAPGKSGARMEALKGHIAEAEKQFAELKQIEEYKAQMAELGEEYSAAAFEKQISDIMDDLDMKVGTQIQEALNDMSAAEMAGELDTIDGVMQFKRTLLEKLDSNISGYTEGSMKQMQFITQQQLQLANQAQQRIQEFQANAQTVNQDMSAVRGFMVDGNGSPLYDANGNTIPVPAKPPMPPQYDKNTGQLIQFSTDASGQIVASVSQVTPEATFAQQTVNSYASLVRDGKLDINDVPANMKNQVVEQMAMGTGGAAGTGFRGTAGATNVGAKDRDTDLNVGDPVPSPVNGTFKSLTTHKDGNVSLEITTEDGYMIELNHLDPSTIQKFGNMKPGDPIRAGDVIGIGGNTGDVKDIQGNRLRRDGVVYNQAKLDQGFGSHLDVRMVDPNGKNMSGTEVQNYIKGQQGPAAEGMDAPVPMNEYERNITISRMGKQIYGTRISDKESERVEGFITEGMKQGKTQKQIMDDVLGYNVTTNKELGNNLRDLLMENAGEDGIAGFDMYGLARLLNEGKDDKAIAKVEKTVFDQAGDDEIRVREQGADYAFKKGDEVVKDIEKNLDKLGIVEGNWNRLKKKFKKSEDFTRIEGGLTTLVAEYRNRMLGSAVSEQEAKFLDSIVADMQDNPFNAIQKIRNFQSMNIDQLNSDRAYYGLPTLDQNTLSDKKARAKLYYQQTQARPQQPEGTAVGTRDAPATTQTAPTQGPGTQEPQQNMVGNVNLGGFTSVFGQ